MNTGFLESRNREDVCIETAYGQKEKEGDVNLLPFPDFE